MKYFATIGAVLAVSQCLPQEEEPPTREPKAATVADAGAPDQAVGVDAVMNAGLWLEPGPEPFNVPTSRIALPGLDATILAPTGTQTFKTPDGVEVKLGEGRNFWLEIAEGATDLGEVRAQVDSETSELVDRYEDAVVWNEEDRWFFQYGGDFTCGNPVRARHGSKNVELMVAACRSIESGVAGATDEPPPQPIEPTEPSEPTEPAEPTEPTEPAEPAGSPE